MRLRNLPLATLLAASTLVTSGCGAEDSHAPAASDTASPIRTVHHAHGTTRVDGRPRRIVALEYTVALEGLLAVGARPIAFGVERDEQGHPQVPPYLRSHLTGIDPAVKWDDPNLEQLVALRPDLLVGAGFYDKLYGKLSKIAPTVLIDYDGWENAVRIAGEATGRQQAADAFIARVAEREEEVREVVADSPLTDMKVGLTYVSRWGVTLYGRQGHPGDLMTSLGIDVVELAPKADPGSAYGGQEASLEQLPKLRAADIIIAPAEDYEGEAEEAARAELERLTKSNALWRRLPAVKAQRVFPVDKSAFYHPAPLGRLALLDEIERVARELADRETAA